MTTIVRPMYKRAMHLSDYMDAHKLDDDAMAVLVGCTRPTISRIRRRRTRPDWTTIQKIVAATGGEVTANDFVEMPEGAAA